MVNELWKTVIDEDDEATDKLSNKLIGNANFGLIEKGGATAHQSILFKSIDETIHYQTEYGGKKNKLSQLRSERVDTSTPSHIEHEEDEEEEEGDIKASYYI